MTGRNGICRTTSRVTCAHARGAASSGTRAGCADCGRGIRAMRALVHAAQGLGGLTGARAPATIFDRARLAGAGGAASSQNA